MLLVFILIRNVFGINDWVSFFVVCGISAILGYIIVFTIVFSRDEKIKALSIVKNKVKG